MTAVQTTQWTVVCSSSAVPTERGVAALLGDVQVAIFRTFDGTLYALDNRDPFTGVQVLSRGIVGSRRVEGTEVPTVASPLLKQVFSLRDGRCLDSEDVTVAVYAIRERDGVVEVSIETGTDTDSESDTEARAG